MNLEKPTFKPLKDKSEIGPIYITKLHDWILKNATEYFQKANEADAWSDFTTFPELVTDRTHLCKTNEPFLVDRDVDGDHTYCICTISENRRVTSQEPVIRVASIDYGIWKNGYFLLPDLSE